MDRAIAFYLDSNKIGEELDFTFSDVIEFDDARLEQCHGYVQWLFPIKEASAYIEHAPLVTDQTLADYNEYFDIVHPRMVKAFWRMLQFYFNNGRGFDAWITPRNHNFLRITRIIKSLKLFGLDHAEKVLWQFYLEPLMHNPAYKDVIGPVTFKFWQDAHDGV